jgi:hypothetical protein
MSRSRTIRLAAVVFGFLFPLLGCQGLPHGGASVEGFEFKILTDATSVRTRLGEYLEGYLAEYDSDLEKHRVFMALDIQKYVKGERLTVRGSFTEDSVRLSYGDQTDANFPVFHILRAEPSMVEKKMEQETPPHMAF